MNLTKLAIALATSTSSVPRYPWSSSAKQFTRAARSTLDDLSRRQTVNNRNGCRLLLELRQRPRARRACTRPGTFVSRSRSRSASTAIEYPSNSCGVEARGQGQRVSAFLSRRHSSSGRSYGFEVPGWSVEVVSSRLLRSSPMGRGSKSIRRWRKDRKRKKAEREKRKLAAADQRRGSSRLRSG